MCMLQMKVAIENYLILHQDNETDWIMRELILAFCLHKRSEKYQGCSKTLCGTLAPEVYYSDVQTRLVLSFQNEVLQGE